MIRIEFLLNTIPLIFLEALEALAIGHGVLEALEGWRVWMILDS